MKTNQNQLDCFTSLKLVETDSADTLHDIKISPIHFLFLTLSSPVPLSLTPSAVLSAHKQKLNLLLMIALLAKRGSIRSRRPATTTGQISWREEKTPASEKQWEKI